MRRALNIRLIIVSVLAVFCVFMAPAPSRAAQSGGLAGSIKKIDRYSRGLKLGMTFAESTDALGAPRDKRDVPGGDSGSGPVYSASWLQDGYSLDAQFGHDDRIVSYGVHWYGNTGYAPEFKDLLEGGFEEVVRLGTRTVTLEGAGAVIIWRKAPVPGSDKFIDVLTVAVKRGERPR